MPWIAPEIARVDAPLIGDDRALLAGRLERNRSCLMYKCGGLTGEQLAERSVPPSTMSLLGVVRHMTEVERHWFRRGFRGERLEHAYRREDRWRHRRLNLRVLPCSAPDRTGAVPGLGQPPTLRASFAKWNLMHALKVQPPAKWNLIAHLCHLPGRVRVVGLVC